MSRDIGLLFIEGTKYQNMKASSRQSFASPRLEDDFPSSVELVELPKPKDINIQPFDLRDAVERRCSVREYTEEKINIGELSYLLWVTQGVKRIPGGRITMRTVPSAGACHAFETYLLINKVDGFAPGLYRYPAIKHGLILMDSNGSLADNISDACLGQDMISQSAVTFFWVAVTERMTHRYGERGYRYLYLDAGHVCQNLYLAVESIGCGACAIGAFDDDEINRILDLDGEKRFVIYIATVGRK